MLVKAECSSCGGTGLYVGFAEPRGTAVVCGTCKGTGCEEIRYTPFSSRKPKSGVHEVRQSHGTFVATGVGPTGGRVTYDQFRNGVMP